jgi:N-acetylmuramic acid 6-phosphate etherase
VYENLMVDVRATNAKLKERAVRIVTELCGGTRAEALAALEQAGWSCKLAIALLRLGVDADEARARLAASGGRLDVLLDRR